MLLRKRVAVTTLRNSGKGLSEASCPEEHLENMRCGTGDLAGRGVTRALLRAGNCCLSPLTKHPAPVVVVCLKTKCSWGGKGDCGEAVSPASLQKAKPSQAASQVSGVSQRPLAHPKINMYVFFVPWLDGHTPCARTGWNNLCGANPLDLVWSYKWDLKTISSCWKNAWKDTGKSWEQPQLALIGRAGEGTVGGKIRTWGLYPRTRQTSTEQSSSSVAAASSCTTVPPSAPLHADAS